jgi:hypothetical protein
VGLFTKKKQVKPKKAAPSPAVVAKKAAASVYDEEYRKELRRLGRRYFMEILEGDKDALRRELSRAFTETSDDMKVYIRRQFSASVDYVRQELARSLTEELAEHRRLMDEAQKSTQASLARSEKEFSERHDELAKTMEKTMADQQARMQALVEESERQVKDIQLIQKTDITRLDKIATAAERQADIFTRKLADITKRHDADLTAVLERQKKQMSEASRAQQVALQAIEQNAAAIEKQYAEFSDSIDGAVARQKALMLETFSQNFARVVEKYLLDALGDQFTVADQLPAIMKQLEADKAAIMEDAKL